MLEDEAIATFFEEQHICNICSIRMKNIYDYQIIILEILNIQNHIYFFKCYKGLPLHNMHDSASVGRFDMSVTYEF